MSQRSKRRRMAGSGDPAPKLKGDGTNVKRQKPSAAKNTKTVGESLQRPGAALLNRASPPPSRLSQPTSATGRQQQRPKGLSATAAKNLVTFVTKDLKVAEESSEKITSILHASISGEDDKLDRSKRKETSKPSRAVADSGIGKLSLTPLRVRRHGGDQSGSVRHRENLFANIAKKTAHEAAKMGYFKPNRYTTEESLKTMTDEQLLNSQRRNSIERLCLIVAILLSLTLFYLALHFTVIISKEPPKIYRLKSRIPNVTVPPGYD
uniref:Uncharacterized protein n=1 Tax=Romanomermis culicivorax TaxID=13658 RepID=A0A915HXV4_ROMCU